jgi:hypothetical protein
LNCGSEFVVIAGLVPECRDGIDNDGDGFVDFFEDESCVDSADLQNLKIRFWIFVEMISLAASRISLCKMKIFCNAKRTLGMRSIS